MPIPGPSVFSIERVSKGEAFENGDRPEENGREGLLIRGNDPRGLAALERTLQALNGRLAAARGTRQADRVDRLVDLLLDGEPLSATQEALEFDNAALRARYLETVPTYTAVDLHRLAGSASANRSALAGGWKDKRRVFAVPHRGRDLFPAFQFVDGKPHPAIKRILSALPDGLTPWQTAFWFASGNGWLGGKAPQNALDRTDEVVAAAGHLAEPTVG